MPEAASFASDPSCRGWLFFRHEADPHLWCAVVHGQRVPDFLLSKAWRHHTRETAALLVTEFRQAKARQGVALNGFYLFQAFVPVSRRAAAALKDSSKGGPHGPEALVAWADEGPRAA